MEELKKKVRLLKTTKKLFSPKLSKLGKRIYYLDVKEKPERGNVHCYHRKQESSIP